MLMPERIVYKTPWVEHAILEALLKLSQITRMLLVHSKCSGLCDHPEHDFLCTASVFILVLRPVLTQRCWPFYGRRQARDVWPDVSITKGETKESVLTPT